MAKKVLLTGQGGFIASHCVRYWLEKTDWNIIGIDSFRNKGYVSRLDASLTGTSWEGRLKSYTHDLTVPIDLPLENLIMERSIDDRGMIVEKPIDILISMASDSAVERSVTDPTHCWRNNCELIINVLELARRIKPKLVIVISTDEVYGEAPPLPSVGHKEWSTLLPSNIYSASKAAQEMAAIAYYRTYDLPIIITNTMNIIGEWQDQEKFLPKLINFIACGKKDMPIYADRIANIVGTDGVENHKDSFGNKWYIGSRVYLDARNKADALMFLANLKPSRYSEGFKFPDKYHICGDVELNNLELAQAVAKIMGKELSYKLVLSETARPGYDRRYAMDGSKLRMLGWNPPIKLSDTLERIIQWTMNNPQWFL